jgi:endo-1,4-beta-xylanase
MWLAGAAALPGGGCARPGTGHRRGPGVDVLGPNSLKAVGAGHGLLVGCAVNTAALASDSGYADLVAGQSSIVVAENAMKWQGVHASQAGYDFDQADALVAFAEGKGIKIRGHNLCWHRSIPGWVTALPDGAGRAVLVEHIERVAGRYAGRMHSWDVVNEGIEPKDGRADGLRNSPWLRLAGEDYIEVAFRTARMADPQALLCFNEYGIEQESEAAERKRSALLLLLRRMRARAVPIDAVGVQSHLAAGYGIGYGQGLMRFMHSVRDMDMQVFITEMDVNDRGLTADFGARDVAVADVYEKYLNLVLAEPALTTLLTWGITDKYCWLNGEGRRADGLPERALPFDAEFEPKAAFAAMKRAIGHRVWPPVHAAATRR